MSIDREALIEAVAESLHNLEYPTWSGTAHPDSNRWSWRGDGHLGPGGETDHYDAYRGQAAAAVDAIVPLIADAIEADYREHVARASKQAAAARCLGCNRCDA